MKAKMIEEQIHFKWIAADLQWYLLPNICKTSTEFQ